MSRLIYTAIFVIVLVFPSWAGEITYTARATIFNDDVRTAQKSALDNALLGGIRYYINSKKPNYKGEITSDYFMFINSYTIIKREIEGNSVRLTAHIVFDDIITDDSATYMTTQANSAVFMVSGIPDYVDLEDVRRNISDTFVANQFSVTNQRAFEREIVDRTKRLDILTAYQAVSSQYLFDFKFSVKSFKAGETCTLAGESSYVASGNITKTVPIISTEVTVDDDDPVSCIITALNTSVDTALTHVRETFIPAPEIKREVYAYTLHFENITGIKDVNDLLQILSKRRFLIKYEMAEFFSDEVIFNVECYLKPDEMSEKIAGMEFAAVKEVTVLNDVITLRMQAKPVTEE